MSDAPAVFDGITPAMLSKKQVGRLLGGMSVSHVERLHNNGRLGPQPVKLGRLVRWRAAELRAWVDADCPPRHEWEKRRGR